MQVIEMPKEEWIEARAKQLAEDQCAPFRDEGNAVDGLIGGPELMTDDEATAFWQACRAGNEAAAGTIVIELARRYWLRAANAAAAADYDMALKHFCLECGKPCSLCECGVPA